VLEKAGYRRAGLVKDAVVKEGRLRDQFRYVREADGDADGDA
jgi:hypothetical protein